MTADAPPEPLASARPSRLRRALPWLAGLAILAVIATRVPYAAFADAMGKGPHLLLAAYNVLLIVVVLCTDSFSTWVGLIALDMRRPLAKVLAVRGATYVLFLLNYAVGQGGFGYYLHKSGTPALRAVGATLFLIGTNLATLLVLTALAWTVDRPDLANPTNAAIWWTLVIGCAGFLGYLVAIVLSPRFVARREVLAPLFDAGLRGHAVAMLGRLPHTLVIVLGHWVAVRAWGIPVPFEVGLTMMPAVAIASVLPISPAGLGTTQAALVFFFADYAAGSTPDARSANVLAFAIVYFVYGVLASLLVGLASMPFAKKLGAVPDPSSAR